MLRETNPSVSGVRQPGKPESADVAMQPNVSTYTWAYRWLPPGSEPLGPRNLRVPK